MPGLYPLKFKPLYTRKIWGGDKFKTLFNRTDTPENYLGESWEISAIQGHISEICNGFLKGNNLQEAIEIYMDEIVGEKIYDKYGIEFPLLIKFIEAKEDLSVQVHPNDELAKERHSAFGKTEMWYVLQADDNTSLINGFKKNIDRNIFIEYFSKGQLLDLLNKETVKTGDSFFIPSGRIHALGAGALVAEIQQTSDITYRIYDYDRTGSDGNKRKLHVDMALDALNYSSINLEKQNDLGDNILADCEHFVTKKISLTSELKKDYNEIDSFVIYMCVSGSFDIEYGAQENTNMYLGETVLLPAALKDIKLIPKTEEAELLEIFVK